MLNVSTPYHVEQLLRTKKDGKLLSDPENGGPANVAGHFMGGPTDPKTQLLFGDVRGNVQVTTTTSCLSPAML